MEFDEFVRRRATTAGGGGGVSLRGRSSREDGARATAEEARKLRSKRATERRNKAMATRVQSVWRGRRARKMLATRLRIEEEERSNSGRPIQEKDVFRASFHILSPLIPQNQTEREETWEAAVTARLLAASVGDGGPESRGGIVLARGESKPSVASETRVGGCTRADDEASKHDGDARAMATADDDDDDVVAVFVVRSSALLTICARVFSRYRALLEAPVTGTGDRGTARAGTELRRTQEEAVLRALIAVRILTDASLVPRGQSTVRRLLRRRARRQGSDTTSLGCMLLHVLCSSLGLCDSETFATCVSPPPPPPAPPSFDTADAGPARKAALQVAALLATRCITCGQDVDSKTSDDATKRLVVDASVIVFSVPFVFTRWRALSRFRARFLSTCFCALARHDLLEPGGGHGTGGRVESSRVHEKGTAERALYILGNIAQSAKEHFASDDDRNGSGDTTMEDSDNAAARTRMKTRRVCARNAISCVTRLASLVLCTFDARDSASRDGECKIRASTSPAATILSSASSQLLDQVQSLCDGALLEAFVNAALTADTNNAAAAGAAGGDPIQECVSSDVDLRLGDLVYFLLAIQPRESARSAALTALAFRANFVRHAWKHVEARLTESRSAPTSMCALPLVISFCEVFAHELIVVDDEDMYEIERPLSLRETANVVAVLKPLVSRLMKEGVSMKSSSTSGSRVQLSAPARGSAASAAPCARRHIVWGGGDEYLVGTACVAMARLLSKLYDRNSRRRFIPAEGFVSDVGDSRFVAEATESIAQMEDDGPPSTADGRDVAMRIGMKSGSGSLRPDTRTVLEVAPFIVSFPQRVRILQSLIRSDRERVVSSTSFNAFGGMRYHRVEATIRRTHVVEDGWRGLGNLTSAELKRSIRINFVNEFGLPEAGVDGGGLFKDFLDCFVLAAFNPDCGLFKETPDHLLYPNPSSAAHVADHLRMFEFLGRMVAKAVYEGILLELPFAGFFLTKLRTRTPGLHDLVTLDPELARSLRFFRRYDGDFDDLSVFFAIDDDIELIPNGRNVPVTRNNVLQYTHLVANHRLNTSIRSQTAAFLSGFQELIRPSWLAMFNEAELQVLLSGYEDTTATDGMSTIIDMGDLLLNVTFSAGYDAQHPTILMLWEVIANFTSEEQRQFLKFVTACSRVPLLGFGALEPKLQIQRSGIPGIHASDKDADTSRLPTSATCMNLLKLPPYTELETLRDKLKYSMQSASGFDLA